MRSGQLGRVYGELLLRRATWHETLLHPFLYVIDFKRALSFGEAVRPEKVDMFSRIGGRPAGIKVRSPLAWAASAEDNNVDEAD